MNRAKYQMYQRQIRARGAAVYWEMSEADRRIMMEARKIRFDRLQQFELWHNKYPHFFPAFRYPK